jgi:hypothetical protein
VALPVLRFNDELGSSSSKFSQSFGKRYSGKLDYGLSHLSREPTPLSLRSPAGCSASRGRKAELSLASDLQNKCRLQRSSTRGTGGLPVNQNFVG